MLRKITTLMIMGFLSLSLASCGAKDDDDNNNPVDEIREQADEAEIRTQMVGNVWTSECMDSDLFKTAINEQFIFETGEFERRLSLFEETDCTKAAGIVKITGSYDVNMLDGDTEVADLDLNSKKITITIENEAAVQVMGAINFCGHTEWTAGEEVVLESVDGESCIFTKLPNTTFGRIEVNGTDKKMFLSETFSEEEAQRPESVDNMRVYHIE